MMPATLGLTDWIAALYADEKMLGMGHSESRADLNLGMGWLYYGLARMQRAAQIVVIGSYRGFVPLVFGRALQDNSEGGQVDFIDPGLVDGFWRQPEQVRAHFSKFGIRTIRHHALTTQEFVETEAYRALGPIDILFVDGYHTQEQARFDHEAFAARLAPAGVVLFHDSVRSRNSRIYGEDKRYTHSVHLYIDALKQRPDLQIVDFEQDAGLTLVKRAR